MSLLPNLEALVVETAERHDATVVIDAHPAADAATDHSDRSGFRHPSPGRSRARRRWLVGLAGATGLAIAGTVAALLIDAGTGTTSSPLDAVAEARAALAPTSGILHIDITSSSDTIVDGKAQPKCCQAALTQHTEQWSTTTPNRFRMLIHPSTETDPRNPRLPLQPRIETAWAGRAESWYDDTEHAMTTVTGLNEHSSASIPPAIPGVDRSLDDLEQLLTSGALHDAGLGKVGDKTVRRLTGRASKERWRSTDIEYDVDPTTFAPVRIVTKYYLPHLAYRTAKHRAYEIEWATFNTFEHLPPTASNEQLLAIHPPTGTRRIVRTLAQERSWGKAREAREDAVGKANLRRHERADEKKRARAQHAAERKRSGG